MLLIIDQIHSKVVRLHGSGKSVIAPLQATGVMKAKTEKKTRKNKGDELCVLETHINKQYKSLRYVLHFFDWSNGFSKPQSKSRKKILTFPDDMPRVREKRCRSKNPWLAKM